jgi:hypothetical protein
MKADVATKLSDLESCGWSSLVGSDDLYLSLPWLTVMNMFNPTPTQYALLWQGNDLAAGFPVTSISAAESWGFGSPGSILSKAAEEGRNGASESLPEIESLASSLICGGRQPGHTGMVKRPDLGADGMETLVSLAEEVARQEGMDSTSFMFVDHENGYVRESLSNLGYHSFESGNYASLPVIGGGFAGYLRQFSSHRKRRMAAERRQFAHAGMTLSMTQLTVELITKIAPLEALLYQKHGTPTWTTSHSKLTMRCLLAQFQESLLVSLAQSGDGIIRGFALIVQWGNSWYVHTAGFDYEFQGKIPLYPEVIFYNIIDAASTAGVRRLRYGLENEEGKAIRGCVLSPQYAYFNAL